MQKQSGKNIMGYKAALYSAAFIEAFIILYLTNVHGISVNPDSSYYISAAVHIAEDGSFTGYNNGYFVLLAPFYPFILALIKILFSIEPLASSGFINAICLGMIVFISGLFLLKHLRSFLFISLGTISIMISFLLVKFGLYALSESLFILFVILYLYFIDIYAHKNSLSSLILFSIFVSLACLTRYVGIIIILCGVITIFLSKKNTKKEKFTHSTVFAAIAGLPICLWIIRNYFISNTLFGSRHESSYTLVENLTFFFSAISNWIMSAQSMGNYLPIVLLIILISAGAIIFLKMKKKEVRFAEASPALIFIAIYCLAVIISSSIFAYDRIGGRLLLPIYVPLLLVVFYFIDRIQKFAANYSIARTSKIFFTGAIIIWMFYLSANSVTIIRDYIQKSGFGFGSKAWENSSIIHLVKSVPSRYKIYSNAPDAVYILTQREAHWSPGKRHYNSPQAVNPGLSVPIWDQKNERAILIWFNNVSRKFLFTLDELKKSTDMHMIAGTNDGGIYVISQPD